MWDISRLIDWAVAHQGVDPDRIAITGNSDGGTVSLFAAACDTRVSVAVPGCYFNTFAGSIGSIIHCDCNYVPGILRLGEMHDLAGWSRRAPSWPSPAATTRSSRSPTPRRLRATGECELCIGDGGHRYYKKRVWSFVAEAFAAI